MVGPDVSHVAISAKIAIVVVVVRVGYLYLVNLVKFVKVVRGPVLQFVFYIKAYEIES